MMKLRKLLYPFSVIYGFIVGIRNFLYDCQLFKSYSFDVPVICVGNLSVGGTGKTPHIEYLIRLLKEDYKVAVLSRGYKRKSKGFQLAHKTSSVEEIGDEPFQMFQKFPEIIVAVDADRKNGIEQLLQSDNKPDIILLDDAFQHRRVKAGFTILLSSMNDLYYDDLILPAGNLRESKKGVKRADIIVITKCKSSISEVEMNAIKSKINLNKNVFFSFIAYDDYLYNEKGSYPVNDITSEKFILVAGIASPKEFVNYFRVSNTNVMVFSDHHNFTEKDIKKIENKANGASIITTEKDYVRLKKFKIKSELYYLPIKTEFVTDKQLFNKTIQNYVGTSTRNS